MFKRQGHRLEVRAQVQEGDRPESTREEVRIRLRVRGCWAAATGVRTEFVRGCTQGVVGRLVGRR